MPSTMDASQPVLTPTITPTPRMRPALKLHLAALCLTSLPLMLWGLHFLVFKGDEIGTETVVVGLAGVSVAYAGITTFASGIAATVKRVAIAHGTLVTLIALALLVSYAVDH